MQRYSLKYQVNELSFASRAFEASLAHATVILQSPTTCTSYQMLRRATVLYAEENLL